MLFNGFSTTDDAGEFAVFVQIVEIEHPAQTIFDRTVNEDGKGADQIFETDVSRVRAIDISKENDGITITF